MKSLGTMPSLGLVNVSGMSEKSQEAAPNVYHYRHSEDGL